MTPRTLEEVRDRFGRDIFPHDVLEGCETALVLFCAAFHGRQDAFWIADAGLRATCVDLDHDKLAEMQHVYPDDWEFVNDDVFEFAVTYQDAFDVVTLDPNSDRIQQCADELELWCSLARHAVILTTQPGTRLTIPQGWKLHTRIYRSTFNGGIYWTVFTHG
jgi:hypothetical protein